MTPGQWQRTEHGRKRCHHDGAKTQLTGLVNRLGWTHPSALPNQSKVNHQNRVFLHNADEQNHPNQGDHGKVCARHHQSDQGPHARRRQGRQNRDGVQQTLIEHPQDQIQGDQGRQNEEWLRAQGLLKRIGVA